MASITAFAKNDNRDFLIEESTVLETLSNSIFQTEILIGGVEVIEQVFDEWTDLCEEGASSEPFFRPEWFAAFVRNFENEILLLTVRRGGKLRAVLPLARKNGSLHGVPVRKLQAVFNLQTQRFDLIHGADETERKAIIEAVWKTIKKQKKWHVWEIRLVKKDSWLNDLLALAEKENYKTGVWQMDGAPFIALPQGDDKEKLIEEFSKSLKRHFRQELKRRLRRLKELGSVEFVVRREYSPDSMRRYFDLEAQSWKGRGGTAAVCDARAEKLHDDFARAVAARNALFIYELRLDGKTIAMSINIKYDRQTIFWKTSFDENYSRYSPGNLLIQEFLADCIRNGSTELDMLSPATDYKKVWASGEREHAAFYVFQPGIFGSLLWKWKFSAISYLRKFKNTKSETVTPSGVAR
ncbi:MAG: GNAT family N-acetyltransferase [Pyrinomonadaceae bacterium]|nr:GNAT family N-acetyltransferase [Pyrinomonadaceae bacterium]